MAEREPPYLHGTSPEEQLRLSKLNELLNAESLRMLDLRGGERVLDVGCGLAQLTRAMARDVGEDGCVVGVESRGEQLSEASDQARGAGEERLIELRRGDAVDLPLAAAEWGSFDVVHARFVLEHVADPSAVVRSMVRAAKPGGRVIVQDDDHDVLRLWPELPGVQELWLAYVESFRRVGAEPFVGRQLVALLHEAGARPNRNTQLFFGGCSGDPSFPAMVANFAGILEGARGSILSNGLFEPHRFGREVEALRGWGSRPDAALWYTAAWAEGLRR